MSPSPDIPIVSRVGLKLDYALNDFELDVIGDMNFKTARVDIGYLWRSLLELQH